MMRASTLPLSRRRHAIVAMAADLNLTGLRFRIHLIPTNGSNNGSLKPKAGALNITGTFVSGKSIRFGANASALLPAQPALITVNGIGSFTLNSAGYLIEADADPYDLWKTQITNGLDERGGDADGDGLTNLGEFLFGTPPMSGNSSPIPALDGGQSGAPADYDFQTVTLPAGPCSGFHRIEAFEN